MAVFRITLFYIIVAGLWILLSDRMLTFLVGDSTLLTFFQTVKGWFFVIVTAAMLHLLISRYMKAVTASEAQYRKKSEELSAYTEELIATEEELRQQFDELVSYQNRVDRQNQYLAALHETALELMGDLDLNELLEDIVQRAVLIGKSQHGYLYLLDKETMEMEIRVRVGMALQPIGFRQKKGEGVVGRVWETAAPVVIEDYNQWEGRLLVPSFSAIEVSTGFPLIINGEVIGVFGMNYTEKCTIDEDLVRMMSSFAEMASIALRNAQMHNALQESQAQSRILIEAMPDLVYRLNQDGVLLAYELGQDHHPTYDLRGKVGQNIRDLVPAELASMLMQNVQHALANKSMALFELRINDENRTQHREIRMVPTGDSEVMAVVRDITEQKTMEEQLRYMGQHDPVTGLYNRAYFNEVIDQMVSSQQFPVGVVVCDIDGLKLINDSFGQEVGDQLLNDVAHTLTGCARIGDIVARIGGDEFAVLMPSANKTDLERVCQCIRGLVSHYEAPNPVIPISVSLGTSLATSPGQDIGQILKNADDSMYREKLHRGQSVRSAIVSTLAKAMEARDFITDGHADRLQDIVELVAREAGVTENNLPDYRLLARFHDIGKVGIPDNILFKPGRLTPEEYEIMKRHCEIGYRIALASPELAPIADWILKHQEWWNGEGYPLGIKGEEIPLVCRILSLADAYDAMTNDRPYRKAMTHDEAMREILRCAGKQFDPELAEIFVSVVQPGDEAADVKDQTEYN